ncbi:MAG: DUF29 domain-containing protein, partial [Xenococcus sp. (in: cyanobacteria)]
EEIEDMGKSEKRSLESYLERLVEHILKLKYWRATPRYPKGLPSGRAERYPLGRRETQTPVPSSRRQSLQRGEPPQRAALGTRPTDWLGNARDETEKERNYKHWQVEVVNFRNRIFRLLDRSPSLKNYMQNIYPKIFNDAVSAQQIEFTIPQDNFIELKEILKKDYFG